MNLSDKTADIQNKLGEYCLTGQETIIPGVTPGRLKHYRRLVSNGIKGSINQAFPLARNILKNEQWETLQDDFLKHHKKMSNQIWKLPQEFYLFVKEADYESEFEIEWLNELLLFEWTEIEVFTMPDKDYNPENSDDKDFMNEKININPEYRIIKLNYPVHIMPAENTPQHKGNYFVLMSRHPESGKVYFFNFTVLHAWIFENLEKGFTLNFLITQIPEFFGLKINDELKTKTSSFINDLKNKKAIY